MSSLRIRPYADYVVALQDMPRACLKMQRGMAAVFTRVGSSCLRGLPTKRLNNTYWNPQGLDNQR